MKEVEKRREKMKFENSASRVMLKEEGDEKNTFHAQFSEQEVDSSRKCEISKKMVLIQVFDLFSKRMSNASYWIDKCLNFYKKRMKKILEKEEKNSEKISKSSLPQRRPKNWLNLQKSSLKIARWLINVQRRISIQKKLEYKERRVIK